MPLSAVAETSSEKCLAIWVFDIVSSPDNSVTSLCRTHRKKEMTILGFFDVSLAASVCVSIFMRKYVANLPTTSPRNDNARRFVSFYPK